MNGFRHGISSTVAFLIVVVGVLLGTLLLVLPGLFLAAAWTFVFHAMAYEDLGVGAALSRSYGIFKEHALLVIILLVGMAILNSFASAFIFLELLTIPYSMVAMTIAYEKLAGSSHQPASVDQMNPYGVNR